MVQHTIPVVDLHDYSSPQVSHKDRFVKGVGDALRDVGFFALTNHGIDGDLITKAYQQVAEFFAMPEGKKKRYEQLEIKGQRGFTSFGREHAKDSNAPDLKEFWHVGREFEKGSPLARVYPENVWPEELPDFRRVMVKLYSSLEHCALTVLEACSLYLGEDEKMLSEIAVNGNSILRLIHYPPIPPTADPQSVRAQAHEDINLITLLIEATSSGLELKDRSGKWMPVVTPKDCIIIDAGDMLQNITNGFYKSTTHRVVNPKDSNETRYSMPFFMHARGEVNLSPLSSCLAKTGGKELYPRITADQYLLQRLKEIGLA